MLSPDTSTCKDSCVYGTCENGYCSCYTNYSGPTCETATRPIITPVNNTEIKVIVGNDIYFSIQIQNISEYTSGGALVRSYGLDTQNISETAESINFFL